MKLYFKFVVIAILFGLLGSLSFLTERENIISISEIILRFGFSAFELSTAGLVDFFICFFPLLLFQILWGTYIYRHFCSASIYYFSRCTNRILWYLKEVAYLFLYTIIYLLLMIFSGVLLVGIFKHLYFDLNSLVLLMYFLLIYTLWVGVITLLVNLIAIKLNSSGGFIIVGGIQMLCMAMFATLERYLDDSENPMKAVEHFLKYNPLSHLVLHWHSSSNATLNNVVNRFEYVFDLNYSVIILVIFNILVICLGGIVIKYQDIITSNKEMGGI